jgi:molybdopterin/thiamine biosynthesis adenylyltransferase
MIVQRHQKEPGVCPAPGLDCRLLEHPDLGSAGLTRLRDGGPVAVAGLGTLGARVALSLAALGVPLLLIDRGSVEPVNVGIQPYTAEDLGLHKTRALCRRVHSIRPEPSIACFPGPLERIGPRILRGCRLVIGAVDSFRSRLWLAQTTAHLGVPSLDLALDGTGRSLLGRVSGHDVANGGACYACGWDDQTWDSVLHEEGVSGCVALASALSWPSVSGWEPPATLALPGLAEVIAGIAAIQATRVLLGSGRDRVIDHECRIDLSSGRYSEVRLTPSPHCRLSHQRWNTLLLDHGPADLNVASLFDLAAHQLGGAVSLAVPGETLILEAACPSCQRPLSTICVRSALPPCPACRGPLIPLVPGSRAQFRVEHVAGVMERSWHQLGLPPGGAVRATNRDGQERVFLFDARMPGGIGRA